MIIEKFIDFNNKSNNKSNNTKIDIIEDILSKIDKGYSFKFASDGVFCFTKDNNSILVFDENFYVNIQNLFNKKELIKNIGGYNIYKINKKLENPFFNDSNRLESHFYFRDSDYFKKIKYFISKIMNISDEIGVYPKINWDDRVVKIIIESDKLTESDFILANKISDIWKNIL